MHWADHIVKMENDKLQKTLSLAKKKKDISKMLLGITWRVFTVNCMVHCKLKCALQKQDH